MRKVTRDDLIIFSTAMDEASERLLNDDPENYENLDNLMAWVSLHIQLDLERVYSKLKDEL